MTDAIVEKQVEDDIKEWTGEEDAGDRTKRRGEVNGLTKSGRLR